MNAMTRINRNSAQGLLVTLVAIGMLAGGSTLAFAQRSSSFASVVNLVQPKIVKIYGAGGFGGLEDYQSGFLISAEGHVLTAWSYVLDSDVVVMLDDGRRYEAQLIGADPRLELAVIKFEGSGLDHFDLDKAAKASADQARGGTRVLAFSNLFGVATGSERASVLHGSISVRTKLRARRGVYKTPYRGDVYILDAMTNNPGAAGGALTDRRGQLLAVLGKELRNSQNNTWLNYAMPIDQIRNAVADLVAGKVPIERADDERKPEQSHRLGGLGLVMVPDVHSKTPPFVDQVRERTAAATAGIKPDDLVLLINDHLVSSCQAVVEELSRIDRADPVRMTVLRDGDLVEFTLNSSREVTSE